MMMQMPAKLSMYLYGASRDMSIVRQVYQTLKEETWINPWLDSEEIVRGSGMLSPDLQADTAMFSADVIMVFASSNLDYQKVLAMLDMGKPLLILRLDDTGLPFGLARYQSINFFPPAKRSTIFTSSILDILKRYAESLGVSVTSRFQPQDVNLFSSSISSGRSEMPGKAVDEPVIAPKITPSKPALGKSAKSRKPDVKPAVISGQVFISYSRKDANFANRINSDLNRSNIKTWIDRLGIRKGDEWPDRIANAIVDSVAVLMIVSANALESEWVKREISFAQSKKKAIFPLILEDCQHPYWFEMRFGTTDWTDFSKGNYKEKFEELLRSLYEVVGS